MYQHRPCARSAGRDKGDTGPSSTTSDAAGGDAAAFEYPVVWKGSRGFGEPTVAMADRLRVASGVSELDHLLGGLFIGDNVVWHDDAGSLAAVFCLNFLQASEADERPIIYVSFDRSPKNLLDKLGPLAETPWLTVLDCFTWGKGAGSDVFKRFYYEHNDSQPCRVVPVHDPGRADEVMDAFYGLHSSHEGDVRFIFESLTGMQELWGGEDELITFYAHSCPRLYELNTVAYWILEKKAHSQRLRAQINQIAQVVVDLSIRRGTTFLTVVKAENRDEDTHHKPHRYWTKDLEITFESEHRAAGPTALGRRLKHLRSKKGLSQTDLAKMVGVTPSTISQVESNLIYPSVPALLKMADVLNVDISSFFQERPEPKKRVVFPAAEAEGVTAGELPSESVQIKALTPVDFPFKAEPYIVEIMPQKSLASHFFTHKGEEIGHMVSGRLQLTLDDEDAHTLKPGDVVCLTSQMPTRWHNPGRTVARLFWMKIK